ncbi:short-chain dehydrogenase/reductase [Pestalotiopsis sp. NC0098]|nr:short-chain dehydrogenase/reductase [Pestalotiopsis sp. NC0098]
MPRKTIFITGCGPAGIGHALAVEFQLRGHRVVASGLNDTLLRLLQDLGIHTIAMDVTSEPSIAAAVSHVSKIADGRIDILINNAGVIQILPLADTPIADARRLFEVNVLGTMAVTQAFLPLLLRSTSAVVANLGSVNQVLCPPFFAAYNASKAAVEALTTTMRRELAPLGVRAVLLKTGSVRTGLFGNALGETRLPEGSLYAPLREWIEGRQMELQGRHIDGDVYARGVVDELLRENVRNVVWRGGLTTLAWVLTWLGWEGMLDWPMIKGNGLDKIQRPS